MSIKIKTIMSIKINTPCGVFLNGLHIREHTEMTPRRGVVQFSCEGSMILTQNTSIFTPNRNKTEDFSAQNLSHLRSPKSRNSRSPKSDP